MSLRQNENKTSKRVKASVKDFRFSEIAVQKWENYPLIFCVT